MARTPEVLWEQFKEQLEALESSCAAFDNGKSWEAKRIAAVVHILLHDPAPRGNKPSRTQSLLKQLGRKAGLHMISTAAAEQPGNPLSWLPLARVRATVIEPLEGGLKARYVPHLENAAQRARKLKFSDWWEEAVLIDRAPGGGGAHLSRKNLILTFRDQEGGSHYDAEITEKSFERLLNGLSPGWQLQQSRSGINNEDVASKSEAILGAHLATCRQIGWEVLKSLEGIPAR